MFFKSTFVKIKVKLWVRKNRDKITDNYTKLPHEVLTLLSNHKISGNERWIYIILLRQTIGCGKETCAISYNKFVEYGMSYGGVRLAIKRLEEKGLIGSKLICPDKQNNYKVYWINGGWWEVSVRRFKKEKVDDRTIKSL